MKTVSTKVDSQVYQQLLESCGKSNCSVSEKIRNLIECSLELKVDEPSQKNPEMPVIKLDECPIIPELNHNIKTSCEYVIVNGQYFKKCDPLPKVEITLD